MCLIVDANVAAEFLGKACAVLDWLLGEKGEPRLVASGLLREELVRLDEVRRILLRLDQAGRLRTADATALTREERHLHSAGVCRSNDCHVLALAIVSGARTLATLDDDLTADFKDQDIINRPRGKVYRDHVAHARLLGHTPSSCGVKSIRNRPRRRGTR